jgi:hypothetical protein
MSDLFDGRLARFDVTEPDPPNTASERMRCLSNGQNYVWVYRDGDGNVRKVTSYGLTNPCDILSAICTAFDTDVACEDEPQFWGFDSQEEWDIARRRWQADADDRFYRELLKFLAGEPCDIAPGTTEMIWAQVAKELIAQDPEMGTAACKDRLLSLAEPAPSTSHSHPSVALQIYVGLAWLSLPGTWWLGFEMYVWTLARGPGMLLYGVLHSWPLFGLLVVLALWLLPIWLLLTIAALVLPGYQRRLGLSRSVLLGIALAIGLQIALLVSYERWSPHSGLRVVLCLMGLLTLSTLTVLALGRLRRPVAA